MNLKNNTILITGGTSGFGYEFASKLVKLDKVKNELPEIHTFQSDVSNSESIVSLFEKIKIQFPELNFLINNAGEMRKIALYDNLINLNDITKEIEINLMGPIRMVQQFLPLLMKQESAAILNVSSGLALIPFPISPIYGATKSGLHSYTQSLRTQLENTSVKVFELLAPGSNTPLNQKFGAMGMDEKMMMDPSKLIDVAIEGLKNNTYEIYPGISKMLRVMSRLAPKFLLKQMNKAVSKLAHS